MRSQANSIVRSVDVGRSPKVFAIRHADQRQCYTISSRDSSVKNRLMMVIESGESFVG